MNTIGRIFWIIAQLIFIGAVVGLRFVNDKLDSIITLCFAIGLMLIASRLIDDANKKS